MGWHEIKCDLVNAFRSYLKSKSLNLQESCPQSPLTSVVTKIQVRKDLGENSVRDILKVANQHLHTVGHTEINAWGQNYLYSLVVTSTGKLTGGTKNQECVHAPGVSTIWKA
ncbi:hypothetical protein [Microcoleus sp. EPA2]|uniref:hypothetical protein n=1 Tax=Microcoleus sp. EPA2 TaxID=2841654 RepID=UPI00312B38C8